MLLNWLSAFTPFLKSMISSLWTPWLILAAITLIWISSRLKLKLASQKWENIKTLLSKASTKLENAKSVFGAQNWPNSVFLITTLFWFSVFSILFAGLTVFIVDIIMLTLVQSQDPKIEFKFLLAKTGALTAVLGAVTALPFTVIRLKLTTEQNKHNENVLYNDKLHEANNDLHAQRQVTVFVKDDEGNETTKRETVWEDDIIRRNGAIDRLGSGPIKFVAYRSGF